MNSAERFLCQHYNPSFRGKANQNTAKAALRSGWQGASLAALYYLAWPPHRPAVPEDGPLHLLPSPAPSITLPR